VLWCSSGSSSATAKTFAFSLSGVIQSRAAGRGRSPQ
jgi:hypothetical protein